LRCSEAENATLLFEVPPRQRNLPHSAACYAGSLRFSDSAGAREIAILKKTEDRSNISRPVSALSCDARRLQGKQKTVPIGDDGSMPQLLGFSPLILLTRLAAFMGVVTLFLPWPWYIDRYALL
jgi:hypothetical protein